MSASLRRAEERMWLALATAAQTPAGDVPVGAVVLSPEGTVLAEAANAREAEHDPTAHAEIRALRAAGAALGTAVGNREVRNRDRA